MYISVSWSLFLSFSLNTFLSVRLYYHWLYLQRYVSWSAFLCLFLSVSVSPYIFANCTCIRTSLDSYFFLSLCLWMCVAVSGCVITHRRFTCTSLDPCLCLFVWIFLSLCGYVLTNCTCKGTSLDPRFCLCFSLSVSESEYIIDNFLVCEQTWSARKACNSAVENSFFPF